jgi:hypothetical protein
MFRIANEGKATGREREGMKDGGTQRDLPAVTKSEDRIPEIRMESEVLEPVGQVPATQLAAVIT